MAVHPASRRVVARPDPVTSPSGSRHGEQLDLRLNSIQVRPVAAKANLPGKEVDGSKTTSVNELDGLAKQVGGLVAEALRYSGLSQKECSFRMGYADASKLARWISGEDVSSFMARFLSLPEIQRGFLVALAEHARVGVKVRTVVEIEQVSA